MALFVTWRQITPVEIRALQGQEASLVYFVLEGGSNHVKIGTSTSVLDRVRSMSTGNPHALVLLAVTGGGTVLEHQLHARFSGTRLYSNREWFAYSKDLEVFVEGLPKEGPLVDGRQFKAVLVGTQTVRGAEPSTTPKLGTPQTARVPALERLGIPSRLVGILKEMGVSDLQSLAKVSAETLSQQPGFGSKSLAILNKALKPHGVCISRPRKSLIRSYRDWEGHVWLYIWSKWDGFCAACGNDYRVGQTVMWRQGKQPHCGACWAKLFRDPPKAPPSARPPNYTEVEAFLKKKFG